MASTVGPASSISGHSGVPVHSAVPIASWSQGRLSGRGSNRPRPFPAHSMRHRQRHARAPADVVECQLERPLDEAADRQSPGRRVHLGDVEMEHLVVEPGRRDVVAQRLERHPLVAECEAQLVEGEGAVGGVEGGRDRGRLRVIGGRHGPAIISDARNGW